MRPELSPQFTLMWTCPSYIFQLADLVSLNFMFNPSMYSRVLVTLLWSDVYSKEHKSCWRISYFSIFLRYFSLLILGVIVVKYKQTARVYYNRYMFPCQDQNKPKIIYQSVLSNQKTQVLTESFYFQKFCNNKYE